MIAKILRYRLFLPALLVVAIGAIIGYYIAMAADGEVLSYQMVSSTEGGFSGALDDADQFGVSVARIGDLNSDGVDDLVVGAMDDDDGGSSRGAVYILFMDADGTLDATAGISGTGYTKISDTAGDFSATIDDADRFGAAVANVGDVNNDGVTDIAVGAIDDDDGGASRGAVYILFLDTDGTLDATAGASGAGWTKLSDTSGDFTATFANGNLFGNSIAGVGDLNADGVEDIAAGTYATTEGGALFIIFLDTDGSASTDGGCVCGFQRITEGEGGLAATIDAEDAFGFSVANVGDLNEDGVTDLIVGAPYDDDGGDARGAAYILFMDTDGTVDDGTGYAKISDTAGSFTATIDDNDQFGYAVGLVGDVNQDGVDDLVVGTPYDDDGGTDRGAFYILFMDTDGSLDASAGASTAGYTKVSDTSGGFSGTISDNEYFGSSVGYIGDHDEDGNYDVLVGAQRDSDGGVFRGANYTFFLDGADATAPTAGGGGAITAVPDFFTMALSWTAATDNVTAAGSLVYKVYRAAAGADLDSVADIEANGTLVSTQTSGDVTYTLVDLQPNTVYTYNVIVSDEAGNKTAYTQGSTETLYPSQVTPVFIERSYFNVRGDECTWDRNIILEVGGRNVAMVVVSDNPEFEGASWMPFATNTTIRTMGGPMPVMEIRERLPAAYGKYTYYALVKSVTGNQSRTMIDSITLTSRRDCEYPSRHRVPYFGKSDADIAAYQDAIDNAMDLEEEAIYNKKLQDEANEASLVYVQGVKEGDLVKTSDDSALYYVAKIAEPTETTTGLTRHAFPNEQVFSTWYSKDDMKRAQVVSERTMDRIPLKGPMPPKPNSTLVKFENDKTIYLPAININAKPNTTPYNIALRPITTDGLTEELFGREYKTMILTLPESLKSQMTLGNAITKFEASIAKLKNTLRRW